MPSNGDYSIASVPKLLTLDAIELTLILKSIGFRLESLDFDDDKLNGLKNTANINTNSMNNIPLAKTPSPPSTNSSSHFLNVEISCSKSKIVSRLSFKFGENDSNAGATSALSSCTCPSKEMTDNNNSFWEIQSTGTFVNQRRSLGGAVKAGDNLVDNDTSSNLLPVLSPKSITLTQALTQVLLNQYKNDIELGETGVSDYKKIFKTLQRVSGDNSNKSPAKNSPERIGDAAALAVQNDELNLITPMSSMNVTPTDPNEDVQTQHEALPMITLNNENGITNQNDLPNGNQENAALEDTVNTEAFPSPGNDLFTSSPNGDQMTNNNVGRDANVIHNLNQIRQCVDSTLLLMKLNVTHNLSHDSTNLLTVTPRVPNDSSVTRFIIPPVISKGILTGGVSGIKRTPQMAVARLTPNTLSSGNIARKSLSAVPKKEPITSLSRSNSSASLVGRTKVVPLRRASVVNRTLSSSETSSARSSVTTKTRPVASSISRRPASSTATASATSTASTTGVKSTIRRTVATAKAVVNSKLGTTAAKTSSIPKK